MTYLLYLWIGYWQRHSCPHHRVNVNEWHRARRLRMCCLCWTGSIITGVRLLVFILSSYSEEKIMERKEKRRWDDLITQWSRKRFMKITWMKQQAAWLHIEPEVMEWKWTQSNFIKTFSYSLRNPKILQTWKEMRQQLFLQIKSA